MKTIHTEPHFSPSMHRSRTPLGKIAFDTSSHSIKCFIEAPPSPYLYDDSPISERNIPHADLKACSETVFDEKELLCGMMSELFIDEEPASIKKTVLNINYSPSTTIPSSEEADPLVLFQSWRGIFNSRNEVALQGNPWPIFTFGEQSRQERSQVNLDKEERSTYLSSSSSRQQLPDYRFCFMQKTPFYPSLETKRKSCPAGGCFAIDSAAIERDGRTTLMIRHIPNKYTEQMLFRELPRRFREAINFLYLPLDAYSDCNIGYAFVNFVHTRHIRPFLQEFSGRKWSRFNSGKICELTYARIQGANSLTTHFPDTNRRRGKTENHFSAQHTNATP